MEVLAATAEQLNSPEKASAPKEPIAPAILAKPPASLANERSGAARVVVPPLTPKQLAEVRASRDRLEFSKPGKRISDEFDWSRATSTTYVNNDGVQVPAFRIESKLRPDTPLYLVDANAVEKLTGKATSMAMHDVRASGELAMVLPTGNTLQNRIWQLSMKGAIAPNQLDARLHYSEFAVHEYLHRQDHLRENELGFAEAVKVGFGEISVQVKTKQVMLDHKTQPPAEWVENAAKSVAQTTSTTHYMMALLGQFGGVPEKDPHLSQFLSLCPGGDTYAGWFTNERFRDEMNARVKRQQYGVFDPSQADLKLLQKNEFDFADTKSALTRAVKLGSLAFHKQVGESVAREPHVELAAAHGSPTEQFALSETARLLGLLAGVRT